VSQWFSQFDVWKANLEARELAQLEAEAARQEAEAARIALEEEAAETAVRDLLSEHSNAQFTDAVGFRDFRIGMPEAVARIYESGSLEFDEFSVSIPEERKCKPSADEGFSRCYSLDYLFRFDYADGRLNLIEMKLGPYASSGTAIIDLLNSTLGSDPYHINFSALDEKYEIAYNFSESERLLFNAGEIDALYSVFEEGQVTLSLERSGDLYDGNLEMVLTYRDLADGRAFLKNIKPKTAADDF